MWRNALVIYSGQWVKLLPERHTLPVEEWVKSFNHEEIKQKCSLTRPTLLTSEAVERITNFSEPLFFLILLNCSNANHFRSVDVRFLSPINNLINASFIRLARDITRCLRTRAAPRNPEKMCAMRRNGSTTKSFSSKEALVKWVALTYGRSWADELMVNEEGPSTSWLTSSQSSSSSSCFFYSSYFYSTTVLLQTASSSSSVICCSSSFYSTFCFFSLYFYSTAVLLQTAASSSFFVCCSSSSSYSIFTGKTACEETQQLAKSQSPVIISTTLPPNLGH